MLASGEMPAPQDAGAYAFRVYPSGRSARQTGSNAPRLFHVGGMGSNGTLYGRIGTFIGAALGFIGDDGQGGPSHSGGLRFAQERRAQRLTARDLDLAFVVNPNEARAYCAEVAAFDAYHDMGVPLPGRRRYNCRCGRRQVTHPLIGMPPRP